MATVAFVTWDGGGNVSPAIGVAAELRRRGHRIRFLGHPVQARRFAAAGIDFTGFTSAPPFESAVRVRLPQLLGVFACRGMGKDLLAELARDPADLIVVDCFLLGVMDELRRAGRSYVTFEHSFDGYLRRSARGPLGTMLRARGLRPLALIDAGDPVLTPSLAELDRGYGDVVHTGPVVSGVPASPDEPTVLVSLSTVRFAGLQRAWQRVLDAVEGLPARVLATTGPAVDIASLRVPLSVELHPWLPHDEVMPKVSMVVGHGGHATTMLALAHDLPILVLPTDPKTDQHEIGRAIARSGAGRTMSRRSAPTKIRAAIDELLTDGPHREAAAGIGARIRELDGTNTAATVLEKALRDRALH